MSKINEIQKKILQIDSTRFHKLIERYLNKKYNYNLYSIWAKIWEDKPTIWTPDSLLINEITNKYIFAEHTTQVKWIVDKFTEDYKKDINEEKTWIKVNKIESIFFCCNRELDTKEIEKLSKLWEYLWIGCKVITNSTLSYDLLNKYPNIAKEELSISLDTDQILDIEDFIKINDSTPLTNPLKWNTLFREKEIVEITNLIKSNDITIINWSPWVWKTKITIETIRRIGNNNNVIIKCIKYTGIDIYNDIKTYFSDDWNYIIFFDDAFRSGSVVKYLLELINNIKKWRSIKFVFTVRDYAINNIKSICEWYNFGSFNIWNFSDDEIKELIIKEYKILNPKFQTKIIRLSNWNCRIAVLGSLISHKKWFEGINNAGEIYSEYFSWIKKDIDDLWDNFKKVISIVSFFRYIDRTNTELIEDICECIWINKDELWKYIIKLNNYELIDLYNDEIAKISDQIVSSYLFYNTVFIEDTIKISEFIECFYEKYSSKFIEVINSMLSIFTSKDLYNKIKKEIKRFYNKSDSLLREKLIKNFTIFLETETLLYVKDKISIINKTNNETKIIELEFDYNHNSRCWNNLLNLLSNLKLTDSYKDVIDLMLLYLEKDQWIIQELVLNIRENFLYHLYTDYSIENYLITQIIKKCNSWNNKLFTKLFIEVSVIYLNTEYENSYSERNKYYFSKFSLTVNDELKLIRKNIFNMMFDLFELRLYKNEIIKKILSYCDLRSMELDESEILKIDKEFLLEFIIKKLKSDYLMDCILVNKIYKKLKRKNIMIEDKIISNFINDKKFLLYELIIEDWLDKNEEIKYEDFDEYKKQKIKKYINEYVEKDYYIMFETLKEIKEYISLYKQNKDYIFEISLDLIFTTIYETDIDLFSDLFKKYLLNWNYLNLTSIKKTIKKAIECLWDKEVYKLLNNKNIINWNILVLTFFMELDEWLINSYYISELYNYYKSVDLEYSTWLDFIIKYTKKDIKIFLLIIKQLLIKWKKWSFSSIRTLEYLFNPHCDIYNYLEQLINLDVSLIKDCYLLCNEKDQSFDYDCKWLNLILNKDNDFIIEYLKSQIGKKDYISRYDDQKDYSSIWKREDSSIIINRLLNFLYIKYLKKDRFIKIKSKFISKIIYLFLKKTLIYNYWFIVNYFWKYSYDKNILLEHLRVLLDSQMQENINEMKYIIFLFEFIVEFNNSDKIYFIKKFLDYNNKFKDFKTIWLNSDVSSWSWSRIGYLEKKKEYITEIINYVKNKWIDYCEHKKYLESIIDGYDKSIEFEKRRDFMDD